MESNPKYLPAEERRAATVEAVLDLAGERNPAEITTAAIAERMGLTQGALFRHFPTKEAILEAAMTWVSERLLASVDRAAASATSPSAALEAMFLAHIDFVAKHPGVPRMLFGELQRHGETLPKRLVKALIREYRTRLLRLFADGISHGEFDKHLDTEAAAVLFIGTIQGLVMQSLLAGNVRQIRRDAPSAYAIYRRGIGAQA